MQSYLNKTGVSYNEIKAEVVGKNILGTPHSKALCLFTSQYADLTSLPGGLPQFPLL